MKASATARMNQQAGDVLESTIEKARTAGYSSLVMYSSDPTLTTSADSRLTSSGCPDSGTMCVSVPDPETGTSTKENVVTSSVAGYLPNHITTVTSGTNNVPFTVSTYITNPDDTTDAVYRRVTAYVSWTVYGTTHTRVGSSYIADTVRGLQLPRYTLGIYNNETSDASVLAGVPFSITLQLTNYGARDTFDVTSSTNTLPWAFYSDKGGTTGAYDSSSATTPDPALTDTDGGGVKDTDLVGTNNSVIFHMTATVPAGTAAGTVYTTNLTTTSVSAPTASTAQATVPITVTVKSLVTGSPTGTTSPSTSPSNPVSSPPVSSTTPASNPCSDIVGGAAPNTGWRSALFAEGGTTSISASGGNASGSPTGTTIGSSTSTTLSHPSSGFSFSSTDSYNGNGNGPVAEWFMQSSDNSKNIYGPAYITIWAKAPTSQAVSLTGYVAVGTKGNGKGNTSLTSIGSGTRTGTGCNGWQEYTIGPITLSPNPKSITKLQVIQVLIYNSASSNVQVAYNLAASAYGLSGSSYIPSSITFFNGIAT